MSAMSDLDVTLSEMFTAYVVCALWSTTGDDGEPLDDWADSDDVDAHTLEELREDCGDFLTANHADCLEMMTRGFDAGQLGHDFWLTRNRHGAGFWDRGLGELGERLAAAARVYGGVDLYVGDDGRIYS